MKIVMVVGMPYSNGKVVAFWWSLSELIP